MLKFFRRIRQGLISKNRFSKYLLYAIGEILLVMIGILLALQVNNWNEQRKDKQRIKAHLLAIKSDLAIDLELLNSNYRDFIRYDSSSNRMWKFIHDELSNIDTNQLRIDLLVAGHITEYSIVTTSYEDLVGSGNMPLITNNELKRKIVSYYKNDFFVELNSGQRVRYANEYFDIRFKYINPYMISNYLKTVLDVDTTQLIPLEEFEVDWTLLKEDEAYELALSKVISQRRGTEDFINTTRKKLNSLLDDINEELENY